MRHHRADGGADFGGAGRIFLHAGDLALHPFVEGGAQFGPVGLQLVKLGGQHAQRPPGDHRADRPADQPPALLAHPLLDGDPQRVLLAGQQGLELAEHKPEHLLMPPAGHQAVQRPGNHAPRAGAAQDARHDARQHPPGAPVLHRRQQARQAAGERHRRRPRRAGVGQEPAQDRRQVQLLQHAGDFPLGKDMGGDEPAKRPAQSGLLIGQDGGMRDRQPERMAKQRGDREPVGDAANKPRSGGGPQQLGINPRGHGIGRQGQPSHQAQQRGRDAAMETQRAPGGIIRGSVDHRKIIGGRARPRTPLLSKGPSWRHR